MSGGGGERYGGDQGAPLADWQAAGPPLAAGSVAVVAGPGALVGAMVFAPVVHAFGRLRRYAPESATAGDLVASTMGPRAGRFTSTLQLTAYALFASAGAQALGIKPAVLTAAGDPVTSWFWPAWSVTALALCALVAYSLPDRVVTGIVAALVSAGLLTYFLVAVAVLAYVVAGNPPLPIGGQHPPKGLAVGGTLAVLALALIGFEVITTNTSGARSIARPMVVAIGLLTALALGFWYADHLAGTGLRLGSEQMAFIVRETYGEVGTNTMLLATVALETALLLAFLWGLRRLTAGLREPERAYLVTLAVVAVLAVARCRDWAGVFDKTVHVPALIILVMYGLVIEASARIGDDNVIAWWMRVLAPSALAALVLVPLLDEQFSTEAIWPVAIAATVVACAAAVSTRRAD